MPLPTCKKLTKNVPAAFAAGIFYPAGIADCAAWEKQDAKKKQSAASTASRSWEKMLCSRLF